MDGEEGVGEEEAENKIVSPLAEEMNTLNQQFQSRWGWLDLCRKVAEYLHTDFFTIVEQRSVMEVFTITTMMIEDMDRKSIKTNVN